MQVIVYVKICRFKKRKKLSRVDENLNIFFEWKPLQKKSYKNLLGILRRKAIYFWLATLLHYRGGKQDFSQALREFPMITFNYLRFKHS